MISGNKFVIKRVDGVRKQFLILNGEAILGFVNRGKKFTNCSSYTEITGRVDCKVRYPAGLKHLSDIERSYHVKILLGCFRDE